MVFSEFTSQHVAPKKKKKKNHFFTSPPPPVCPQFRGWANSGPHVLQRPLFRGRANSGPVGSASCSCSSTAYSSTQIQHFTVRVFCARFLHFAFWSSLRNRKVLPRSWCSRPVMRPPAKSQASESSRDSRKHIVYSYPIVNALIVMYTCNHFTIFLSRNSNGYG